MTPPSSLLTHLLTNPDFALLLLLAGILLLYAEFNRPGTVLFAAFGTLLVMFAFYGLAQHPINHLALTLACAGLVLVPLGLRFSSPNLFASVGALILICALPGLTSDFPPIHLTTAIFVSLTFSFVTLWLGRIALQARRNKRLPNPTPHSAPPARRVD
jgi:membrane-bound serine protease (ClpP class)